MQHKDFLDKLEAALEQERHGIVNHPTYLRMKSLEDVQVFMEAHVFAVWDFMSLLKYLQQALTCTRTPWVPVGNANTRFLINEIVVGEESDVDQNGNRLSHFELYLSAMKQAGAQTDTIDQFIVKLREGISVEVALSELDIHQNIKDFVSFTFEVIALDKPHVAAAVFTFGREDLIPQMFLSIIRDMKLEHPEKISTFQYYLERHIEVDGDHHGHLALEMTSSLCGDDADKWAEATHYAKKGLEMRIKLWDAVYEAYLAESAAV